MRLCLVPLRPKHKHFDGCADIAAPIEHRGHLRSNRQFYAVARAERERGGRRFDALSDHFHAGENLTKSTAPSQLDSDMTIPT